MAAVELIEMADRIKIFPLIVLGALVILGIVIYFVAVRNRGSAPRDVEGNPVEPSAEKPAPPQASGKPTFEPPAPSKNPGEKILEGADGAYRKGMFPTALMFYKDFELRYAGTEVYDQNITQIWERIHTSGAKLPKKDEGLPAYLEARRKLADEWKKIKLLMVPEATPEAREQVRKFEETLNSQDGRRKVIDAWLPPSQDGK